MDVYQSIAEFPKDLARTAVTIGKFDGLHLGHQALLSDLVHFANEHMLAPVVVTFDSHPNQLLRPDQLRPAILGRQQRLRLMERAGVEVVLELAFDEDLANQSPEDFVREVVVDALGAELVVVGEGFRFGKGGSGDCDQFRQLGKQFGFALREVKPVQLNNRIVSTTWVRELLDEGKVGEVAGLLGRNHEVEGIVEHGLKIGRKIGFPTANLARSAEGYLPLDGVYSGFLHADGISYPAAHSVGINETFQAVPRLVESHVLDTNELDLYDKSVRLEFVGFVRQAAKFSGVDPLVAQINLDLEVVREQLGM